ncbi:MAG: efflux RND transporter periplasmic adaptor subunit, partial [Terriglobia bacterium]
MIVLTRTQVFLLAAGTLLLGTALGLAVAYQDEIRAGVAGQQAASRTEQASLADQRAGQPDRAAPSSGQQSGERKILYWYDPMHPAYKSDKPGIAPDCGMQLVPKYADEAEAMKDRPPGTVMLSPEKQQLIGVRTAPVRRERLTRTVRTVGRIEADETRIARIHVKVAGWVEKVYVDFEGKLVQKGQPLFSLYSPELVSTQKEYLIARRGERYLGESPYREVSEGAESLLRAARERLRLWDISDDQIQKLEETGEVTRTMTLYSPIDGFVLHRNLYEQVYVTPDMQLYEIANLSRVWVYVDIYEYEVPYVRLGQPATMRLSYSPGRTYRGRVTYIYPTLDPQTR